METKKSVKRVSGAAGKKSVSGAKKPRGKDVAKSPEKEVKFSYHGAEAKEVYLAGEFNSWNTQSLPMKKDRKGVWQAKLKLSPGRYEYQFLVDGNWTPDETCSEKVTNSFGTQNCVLKVE